MMWQRKTILALASAMALLPANAAAQAGQGCNLEFAERSATITFLATDLGLGESVAGSEDITVVADRDDDRNGACVSSLRLSRISGVPAFPNYLIRVANRPVTPSNDESIGGQGSQVNIAVPASSARRSVSIKAAAATEWGLTAGRQTEQLQLSLIGRDGSVLDRIPLFLELDVPKTVDVMFVGSIGSGQTNSVDLGLLSQTEETTSQPFGVRIWSSSSYDFVFRSQNAGKLVHRQGMDEIPYSLLVNGQPYELGGASVPISQASASAAGGDSYGMSIRVPARLSVAGEYQDRLTVSVNAI